MCPPMATCLRALDVPRVGGDTMFASMTAAYEGLSDRMKNFIDEIQKTGSISDFVNDKCNISNLVISLFIYNSSKSDSLSSESKSSD